MYFRIDNQIAYAPIALWDPGAERDETPHHPDFEAAYASAALVAVRPLTSGGSVMEAFIDEPVPTDRLRQTLTVNRELRIHCASGVLAIGPADAYWSAAARRKHPPSPISVGPGDYRVKVHTGYPDDSAESEMVHAIGEEDLKYHASRFNSQNWGCLAGLLGLALVPALGWQFTASGLVMVITAAVLAGIGGHCLLGYLNRRNPRFRDIAKRIKAYQANRPFLIFELTRLDTAVAAGMKGGELSI